MIVMKTDARGMALVTTMAVAATLLAAPASVRAQAPASSGPPPPAQAESPAAPRATPDTPPPTVTMADLTRIKRALDASPAIKLDDSQLRYYVKILGKQTDFRDFMNGYDFVNGPTRRGNPMTHSEFLSMVTPREMNSSGGITAIETLQFAFTNWLGQSLIKKAIEDLRNARSEHEIQEIRDRIDRELASLRPPGGSN
jgi:hypothetical protein